VFSEQVAVLMAEGIFLLLCTICIPLVKGECWDALTAPGDDDEYK
jgi:hypothetical protein